MRTFCGSFVNLIFKARALFVTRQYWKVLTHQFTLKIQMLPSSCKCFLEIIFTLRLTKVRLHPFSSLNDAAPACYSTHRAAVAMKCRCPVFCSDALYIVITTTEKCDLRKQIICPPCHTPASPLATVRCSSIKIGRRWCAPFLFLCLALGAMWQGAHPWGTW